MACFLEERRVPEPCGIPEGVYAGRGNNILCLFKSGRLRACGGEKISFWNKNHLRAWKDKNLSPRRPDLGISKHLHKGRSDLFG